MSTSNLIHRFTSRMDRVRWFLFATETRVAKCLVRNEKNQILLVRLAYGPSVWKLPGGMVDDHESPTEAVVRELKEELGIDLNEVKSLGENKGVGFRNNSTIYYFVSEYKDNNFNIDKTEVASVEWFSLDSLPQERAPQVDVVLRLL
jgi:mutator protein MutT